MKNRASVARPPARQERPGEVPPRYREALYWRITQSSWTLTVVNLLSLPMAALMGLLFFGWVVLFNRMPGELTLQLPEVASLVAGVVVTLVLHELAHGLAMMAYGARPRFGILWEGLMVYATSPGYAFRRNKYIVIVLAPLVGLSLAALMAILILPPVWAVLVALCATVNAAGAVGDLWILRITLRYPGHAYVMDERDGMRIFLPA
jgi:hypothetical protein